MNRFTSRPAVKCDIKDIDIRAGLKDAQLGLLQLVTAHLTGDAAFLSWADRIELESKLTSVLIEYRTTGKSAPAPDCLPIFEQLVMHAGSTAMDSEGFAPCRAPPSEKALRFIMDEMRGYPDAIGGDYSDLSPLVKERFHVIICGSGVCGLATAIRLQMAGIAYTVLEADEGIGGTWYQNTYPNVGCDTPSHTYSFSFDPNPNWTKYFAKGWENHRYLMHLAEKYGVIPNVRLGTEVTTATYDEDACCWNVAYRCKDDSTGMVTGNVYVAAVGQLSVPNIPDLKGKAVFKGESMHTARWKHHVSFKGKKVAMIGTGASGMQVGPSLAQEAEHLTIFQSTPQWYVDIKNYKKDIPEGERWCFANVPFYERWYRFQNLYHLTDFYREALTSDTKVNNDLWKDLTEYMNAKIGHDPELLSKMLPAHPPVCTRMLVDNGWTDMVQRENVTLVDGRVDALTENGVVAKGGDVVADADIIVYATGFQSTKFCVPAMTVVGKGGKTLKDVWGDVPTAFLGITMPGFPNFFMTYGPNTNVGSGGSIIWCAENHGRYIAQCCAAMVRGNLGSMEVKEDVYKSYNDKVDVALKSTVWASSSCRSWYKSSATSKVTNNCPYSLEDYWEMTQKVDLQHYLTTAGIEVKELGISERRRPTQLKRFQQQNVELAVPRKITASPGGA